MNGLETEPRVLCPLPKSLCGIACSVCMQLRARWVPRVLNLASLSEDVSPVCAVCYLSLAPWVIENAKHVAWLIHEIEKARGVLFVKDENGYLLEAEDCDRVLMSLAAGERIAAFGKRVEEAGAS